MTFQLVADSNAVANLDGKDLFYHLSFRFLISIS